MMLPIGGQDLLENERQDRRPLLRIGECRRATGQVAELLVKLPMKDAGRLAGRSSGGFDSLEKPVQIAEKTGIGVAGREVEISQHFLPCFRSDRGGMVFGHAVCYGRKAAPTQPVPDSRDSVRMCQSRPAAAAPRTLLTAAR